MLDKKPYLLRAIYEWVLDNDFTPHILVDTEVNEVQVPSQYIREGHIVLNISPSAIDSFVINDKDVLFNARFGGKSFAIYFPVASVAGLYAKENGDGMQFAVSKQLVSSSELAPMPTAKPQKNTPKSNAKPKLSLVPQKPKD